MAFAMAKGDEPGQEFLGMILLLPPQVSAMAITVPREFPGALGSQHSTNTAEEKLSRWRLNPLLPFMCSSSCPASQEMEDLTCQSRLCARVLHYNLIFRDSCSQ